MMSYFEDLDKQKLFDVVVASFLGALVVSVTVAVVFPLAMRLMGVVVSWLT